MMWTLQCQQVAPKWFSRCSIVIPKKSLWSPSDVQVVSKGSPRGPPENHQMVPNIQVRYQFCILFSCFLLFWGAGREAVPSRQGFSISGRVGYWTKYRVAGRVRVGQECRNIQSGIFGYLFYFRVFPGILGISGYVGYFRVYLGLPIYTRVIF